MNERQRMQYLEVMGIDTFVPRFILPVAKLSAVCELPILDEKPAQAHQTMSSLSESVAPEATESREARSEPVGLERISIDNIVAAKPGSRADSKAEPKAAVSVAKLDLMTLASRTPVVNQVRFSLSLWRVGELQVIDSRRQGDALPTDALISNILLAVGCLELHLPKVEMLHWPMVENAKDSGWDAAREMVHGFLDGRLLTKPVAHILLFGQDAYQAVLGEEMEYADAKFKVLPVKAFDAQAVVLPSLADILHEPVSKSEVWLALKDLSRS